MPEKNNTLLVDFQVDLIGKCIVKQIMFFVLLGANCQRK